MTEYSIILTLLYIDYYLAVSAAAVQSGAHDAASSSSPPLLAQLPLLLPQRVTQTLLAQTQTQHKEKMPSVAVVRAKNVSQRSREIVAWEEAQVCYCSFCHMTEYSTNYSLI